MSERVTKAGYGCDTRCDTGSVFDKFEMIDNGCYQRGNPTRDGVI
ncbi:hypothetical protein RUE5091_04411 [Ruegeria denitrificans]|uniref:Uncharacterized protein n=1 Tax=Ruegeria denitrificans TaxID=1715692 RepID=A0A0P1IKD6_9RHOB|nr:hypothetical protein RUE5091_04411 [Ruegeria denitrificans]